MSGLPFPDVSVQLTQRRWRCILDPNLALSPFGAEFARRLAPHAEVWLGTEFFNILDSARIYEKEPELLVCPGASNAEARMMREALRDWTHLRDEAGYGASPFHWIGDVLRESCLPAGMNEDMVARWEGAARSLDACLPRAIEASGPLIATMRDTVALCAVLPAAILTLRDRGAARDTPVLCQHITRWGVSCEQLGSDDDLAAIERDGFCRMLVQAGLARFLWGGMDLVVLHLHAAGVGRLRSNADALAGDSDDMLAFAEPGVNMRAPWDDARAFWYELRPERHHAG
jgi:hypothetical protein